MEDILEFTVNEKSSDSPTKNSFTKDTQKPVDSSRNTFIVSKS